MKTITPRKFAAFLVLLITILALLASCKVVRATKELIVHNKPIEGKKHALLPGNAKRFQQRHDAKVKRQQQKKEKEVQL